MSQQQRTCRQHKGKYISVCSFALCTDQRLCCLKCMVTRHTDHTQHLILLEELENANVEELSVPTNWTNILGSLKDDLADVIKVCKKNAQFVKFYQESTANEISKIDELFDTFQREISERVESIREYVKSICRLRSHNTIEKLEQLVAKLKQVLSPQDLLAMVKQFIAQIDEDGEQSYSDIMLRGKTAVESEFEEKLQIFFSKSRITEEDQEEIYAKFNYLTNNRKNEEVMQRTPLNIHVLNEIRENFLNLLEQRQRFAEIFFPEQFLYEFENFEKMKVYTSPYDEIAHAPQCTVSHHLPSNASSNATTAPNAITCVEPIDNNDFLLVREYEYFEVWDILQHQCRKSVYIAGAKSEIQTFKLKDAICVLFYAPQSNTIHVYDLDAQQMLKSCVVPTGNGTAGGQTQQHRVISLRLMTVRSEDYCIVEGTDLTVALLFDNQDVRCLNLDKGSIVELKNKSTLMIEVLPELRYYQSTEGQLFSSYCLLSASADVLNVWFPLAGKLVRNLKLGLKSNEVLKHVAAFEITNYEKQVSYFYDYVVNCPTRYAVASLTNKSLRIYNWFKAQCLKELAIDDCDRFEILPTFIKSELKNIFLLYNVSEQKPAEYVTCDWSTNYIEYWNSGSMSHYTSVKALNRYRVLELGMYKGPAETKEGSDSKSKMRIVQEVRARIKSLG